MPDTFSPNLAVRLPQTGAYNNTWGSTLNSDTFTLLDEAIAATSDINLGAVTTYAFPPMTPGGTSISRSLALIFAGATSGPVTATLDPTIVSKFYVIENLTANSMTFTYGGAGRTASLQPNEFGLVYADGTDVDLFSVQSEGHGGVALVNRGGTGASTVAGIISVLGLAAIATSGSATNLIAGTVPNARLPNVGLMPGVTIEADPGGTPSGSPGQIFFLY